MRFHSLEQPSPEKVRELQEKIKIKSELKPQLTVIWPLSQLREAAFEEFKKHQPDLDIIEKLEASKDIIDNQIGHIFAGIRKKYFGEKPPNFRLENTDYARWLFSTRKPAFATKYPERLANTMERIGDTVAELKKKFGDGFIGIVLFGSTTKGYWAAFESDLDFMVIADKKQVYEEFTQKLREARIYPCPSCVYDFELPGYLGRRIGLRRKGNYTSVFSDIFSLVRSVIHRKRHDETPDGPQRISLGQPPQTESEARLKKEAIANLFHGLFFGDHRSLSKIQEYVVSNTTPTEWDDIRQSIGHAEANLFKARDRLGISSDLEQRQNEAAALILRTPPSYEETLRILRSRAK